MRRIDRTDRMRAKSHYFSCIPEAPWTHIQPVDLLAAHQVFRVEGRVPGLDVQVSEHDIGDVGCEEAQGGRAAVLLRGGEQVKG